jgi:hypothetical protein
MAYVAGNEFTMGNDVGDDSERPQHKVILKPFFIDITEVTCEEYEKFIRATSRQPPPTWANGHYPSGWERRPVTGISWDDANAYAEWAGKRLPTEQEWEFAARGADGRLYPWGSEWKIGLANAGPTSPGHVVDVGARSGGVSPFGAVDMVGNAWEWTASDFVAYPGGRLPGQSTEMLKVIRGGCFLSRPDQATVTIRVGWPARGGDEYDNTGFRCAKDPPATQSVEAPKVVVAPTPLELVVNPQQMEGTLGQVTFSQKGKTLFYFERKHKRGKIVINGTDYILSRFSFDSDNNSYQVSGEHVTINTSKVKWDADEGGDCAYGGVSTVTIILNGVSATIRTVKLQDCPDPDF